MTQYGSAEPPPLRVNGERLLARLDQLAAITSTPREGVTRLAYTSHDIAGRELVQHWLLEALEGQGAAGDGSASVSLDPAANLIGHLAGSEPLLGALVTGSHLDTVTNAGKFDGAYGVVAAVEAMATLREQGHQLRHALRVVAFSNEEGGRGTAPMVGSRAIAGRAIDLQAVDDDRVALADRLTAAGGRPEELRAAAWHSADVEAVFELHIEQGPVLEQTGRQIGIVDVVSGRTNVEIEVTGLARHAGTTPMGHRADALVTGAQIILAVQALATAGWVRVATVGRVELAPGMRNVIPSHVTLSLDVRDADAERLGHGLDRLDRLAEEIAAGNGCHVAVKRGESVAPVGTDRGLRQLVAEAAGELGLSVMTMPSGAGHDSQLLASLAPIALCFIPSVQGISHSPDELSHPADLVAGANVLLGSLLLADLRLSAE